MAELGERLLRELTYRYIAVLAVLGALAVLSFLGITRLTAEAGGSAERVNLAGRQRMLVERVAFAANHLATRHGGEPSAAADLLAESLDMLETHGAEILGGAKGAPPEAVLEVFHGEGWHLDRDLHDFVAHGRSLLTRTTTVATDDPDLKAISAAASGALLDALEEVTLRFQRDSEGRMSDLMALQGAALVATLLTLVGAALGVFHPMVLRLRADIEDRFRSARDLRESEERLWRILEESPVGVSVSRRSDGVVVFANTRFTDILGMPKEEFVGSCARGHYVDAKQRSSVLEALRRDGHIDDAEVEFRRKNGEPFWSLLTIRSTFFEREPVNLAWIYDITERKVAEQQVLLAAKVLDTVTEGVVITNARNQIIFVNPAFTTITEYSRDEVVGCDPSILSSGRHEEEFYAALWNQLHQNGRWSGEVWNRRKSGEFFAEWLSISVIRDATGLLTHYVAVFSDITHRKEDEERVWRQANYDALTGLPNRSLFLDRLTQAVRQAKRENNRFALMFLDLDGFKAVNDTLGHAAGDVLLQQASVRLADCMRGSDTLARLAGDEFVVILQGVRGREDPAVVAGKILEQLARPYQLEGGIAHVQGSIGISIFPEDADDGPGLVRAADAAMYMVKRGGKNDFRFAGDPKG